MSSNTSSIMLFPLGMTLITPGARDAIADAGQLPLTFLERHVSGDWGELSEADKRENDASIEKGFRILSAYRTSEGVKLWVITEADRSATTILLPSEY